MKCIVSIFLVKPGSVLGTT